MTNKNLNASRGIICRLSSKLFGYFGWPTVVWLKDGSLLWSRWRVPAC
jgi:hypothetical protein